MALCAQTTLEGLGEKFSKAVAIMTWLAKCAKVVAAREHCVEWTTPLGLPVIQPYREKVCCSVKGAAAALHCSCVGVHLVKH